MKNKLFKVMTTVMLAVMMTTATVASVFAEDREVTHNPGTHTITIRGNGQEGLGGEDRFSAYQVFKGTATSKDDQLSGISWGDGVEPNDLVAAMKTDDILGTDFNEAWTTWDTTEKTQFTEAEMVARFMETKKDDTDAAIAFAKLVAAHKTAKKTNSTTSLDPAGWKIDVDEDGYYLIIDNYKTTTENEPDSPGQSDGVVSTYILQVLNGVEIDLKGTVPTVEKQVMEKNGYLTESAKEITYKLTGTVAQNISQYSSYFYQFTDTLSKGITFDRIESVTLDGANLEPTIHYTTSTEPEAGSTGRTILKVTINDLLSPEIKAVKEVSKDSKIVVTYTAHLNKSAVVGEDGNPNDVFLTYSNNPYAEGKGDSIKDEVKTYTLALDITKQDKNGGKLNNAGFKLKNADGQFAKFEQDSDKYYAITGWEDADGGTEIMTADEGQLHIKGLDNGEYTLVETTAPDGYEKMKDVKITISGATVDASGALDTSGASMSIDGTRDDAITNGTFTGGKVAMTLVNYTSPLLPNTGGIGAAIVYLISGIAVVLGAVIVFKFATYKKIR